MFVLEHERNRLDKNGVLRPRLQSGQQDPRVHVFVRCQLHIHHVPAVGAAAVLALELCDVLEGPGRKRSKVLKLVYSYYLGDLKCKKLSSLQV